ncbi:MAG: Tol-Pal system beta propeller repeat protein TolB, partial [Salinisphaera sp.]|nr:Tol-Pal system beta propeller repeat protein TolB [Salinisphaera sp.]
MRNKNKRGVILSLALCIAATLLPADAALRIEITEGVEGALPIAIIPFGMESGVNVETDLAAVVAADLKSTGLFEPLPVDAMLEKPSRPQDVDYANWRQVGVENVVVGTIAANGRGKYRIRFDILGVAQQRSLTSFRVTAQEGELRDAAHAVANLIYENFTGEDGYFDTRIVYVAVSG